MPHVCWSGRMILIFITKLMIFYNKSIKIWKKTYTIQKNSVTLLINNSSAHVSQVQIIHNSHRRPAHIMQRVSHFPTNRYSRKNCGCLRMRHYNNAHQAAWGIARWNDSRLAAPLLTSPFTRAYIGVLMRKGQEDLLLLVNSVIRRMKADGSLRRLHDKYGFAY